MTSLKRRFVFMGMLNFIFAPFIVLYLIMYSFFRYFEACISLPTCTFITHFITGIPQQSFINRGTPLYQIRQVEVSGI
jgi:Autophagy protein ATG9